MTAGHREHGRGGARWGVGLVAVLALAALITSLELYQLTASGPAKAALSRSVAALSEIDPLLARNYDALRTQAAAAAPGEALRLRDFPVDVPLTREEVLGSSRAQLRELLLARAADTMYAHGSGALRESGVRTQGIGAFSIGGVTAHGLGFLRSRNHTALGVATVVLAAACALLLGALAASCRGFGRLGAMGAVLLAAAVPLLAAGISARFVMRIASDSSGDYLQRELLAIGQALAWVPIRDGLAFTALGAGLALAGVLGAAWADRDGEPPLGALGSARR